MNTKNNQLIEQFTKAEWAFHQAHWMRRYNRAEVESAEVENKAEASGIFDCLTEEEKDNLSDYFKRIFESFEEKVKEVKDMRGKK